MPLSKELLSVLACPRCKAAVRYSSRNNKLRCIQCKKEYMIENNIPIMLP